MTNKITVLKNFRIIAFTEGVSYIILLFVAMPLKYMLHIPEPVKYFGWLHGVLFVIYSILLLQAFIVLKWGFLKTFIAFIVSFIPFGTFWLEGKLKKEIEELAIK